MLHSFLRPTTKVQLSKHQGPAIKIHIWLTKRLNQNIAAHLTQTPPPFFLFKDLLVFGDWCFSMVCAESGVQRGIPAVCRSLLWVLVLPFSDTIRFVTCPSFICRHLYVFFRMVCVPILSSVTHYHIATLRSPLYNLEQCSFIKYIICKHSPHMWAFFFSMYCYLTTLKP